jgi:gliding motility-associated-like protein
MNTTFVKSCFVCLLFISLNINDIGACNNLTVSMTLSQNKTCGIPVIVDLGNTSSGSDSGLSTYTWMLDGTPISIPQKGRLNDIKMLTAPGTYRFSLIAKDPSGCIDSAFQIITITTSSPQVKDGTGTYNYEPYWLNCITVSHAPDSFQVILDVGDSAKNFKILWGDGYDTSGALLVKGKAAQHTYDTLGTFEIMIISNNGPCTDTLIGSVVNERQPVAGLIGPRTGTNMGCVPLTVKFKNFSQKVSESTNFIWDMGDTIFSLPGTTYRDSFLHTYYTPHCNTTVKLTAANACGSSVATWNPINAAGIDTARITPLNKDNCDLNTPFRFANSSVDNYCLIPDITHYYWDFGDGTNSGWSTNPSGKTHQYAKIDAYTITLIDSNRCGVDTGYYTLQIDSLPTVFPSVDNNKGCQPFTASFDDKSIGKIDSIHWDFGDTASGPKDTSLLANPSHRYDSLGIFTVVLTVGNNCGNVQDSMEIEVVDGPTSFFDLEEFGCAPFTQTFKNNSTTNFKNETYHWDFGDSTYSTLKNPPSKVYSKAGKYRVTLTISDSCTSHSSALTMEVFETPIVGITKDTSILCEKFNIPFTVTSKHALSHIWRFGDGSPMLNSSDTVVTHLYNNLGSYGVMVIAQNRICYDTIVDSVYINPKPSTAFVTSKDSGCGPMFVSFTNTSSHNGTGTISDMKFIWDQGNGNSNTSRNGSTTYANSLSKDSLYTVTLIGTNTYNCSDTFSRELKVFPIPHVEYATDLTAGCAPFDVGFTNLSYPHDTNTIDVMTFDWDFGNGNSYTGKDTQQTYFAHPTKDTFPNIRLIGFSEHGCTDTFETNLQVFPDPVALFSMDTIDGCNPFDVNFSNYSIPNDTGDISMMSFVWDLGNGDTSHRADTRTTYSGKPLNDSLFFISLIAYSEHNCTDTLWDTAYLRPNPLVDFSIDNPVGCAPLNSDFHAVSNHGWQYTWWINDVYASSGKDPNFTFYGRDLHDSAISIKFTTVSQFGCLGDTISKDIEVYGDPVAQFDENNDSICVPDARQFLNRSINSIRYMWDFGNNDTTSLTNPKYIFNKGSDPYKDTVHNFHLISYSAEGCADTAYGKTTILPYPVSNFTTDVNSGCAPLDVTFSNTSLNYDSISWAFGDGNYSSLAKPTHRYNVNFGDTVFRATITAFYRRCSDTFSAPISVQGPSLPFFQYERVDPCDDGYIQFHNQSINATSYRWDFGDNFGSTQKDPLHLFPTSPYGDTTFNVTLTSVTSSGCENTVTLPVMLRRKMRLEIKDTQLTVCVGQPVQFNNYSIGGVAYFWDFGDNNGTIENNPVHTFENPGSFIYKLIGFDGSGCGDSISSNNTITVVEAPKAAFNYNPPVNVMPSSTFNFIDASISTLPLNYDWTIHDTIPVINKSTLQNPTYTFGDSGWHKVVLIVDNGACSDTAIDSVRVEPHIPIADFTANIDSGCTPVMVQFINNSQYASQYIWKFGDGTSSNDKNPLHAFIFPGYYSISLHVIGPGGEDQLIRKDMIYVKPRPFARFTVTPPLAYLPNAIFVTRNESGNSANFQWNIFDEDWNNVFNTTELAPTFHLYDTGLYTVQLIAYAENECTDTMTKVNDIEVSPRGVVTIPDAFTPDGDGLNDVFIPVSLNLSKKNYIFQVINRWGEVVFESYDPEESWDGTYHGNRAQSGVYAWRFEGQFTSGRMIEKEGIVHLLR